MRRRRVEERLRTQRAATFDRNILQPFGHSQRRFLHRFLLRHKEMKGQMIAGLLKQSERDRLSSGPGSPLCRLLLLRPNLRPPRFLSSCDLPAS